MLMSETVPEVNKALASWPGTMFTVTLNFIILMQGCKLHNGSMIAAALLTAWHSVGFHSDTGLPITGSSKLIEWLSILFPQPLIVGSLSVALFLWLVVQSEKPARRTATVVADKARKLKSNICALKANSKENDLVKEKFNSTYIEIELVDMPGVIIRVLLDSGAAASVFSKRALRKVWHKLKLVVGKGSNLISAGGGSLGVNLGMTNLRFKIPGYEHIYEQSIEVIDNDGVPSIFGVDFLKAVSADMRYSKAGDMASWETPEGETITVPMHCTAPEVTGTYAVTAAEGCVLEVAGDSLKNDRRVIIAHVDIEPSQIRHTHSLYAAPTTVTVECNNSIADDDTLDTKPTTCVRNCYLSPQLKMHEGKLSVVVEIPIRNMTDCELVVAPGTQIASVRIDSPDDTLMANISRQEYCKDANVKANLKSYTSKESQKEESECRVGIETFKPETDLPTGDWRRLLHYDVPKMLDQVWNHESKSDYDTFLDRYRKDCKFGDVLTQDSVDKTLLLLFIFRKCASINPKAPTPIKGLECRLQFKSANPKPYTRGLPRLSPADMIVQCEMTNAMLKAGVIEYADSEWSTGVVMAKKKGTTDKRYAVDYRGLNAELIGNVIGVPRIDDLLDHWGKSKWFSTFDLASAFWSIPMKDSHRKYTAFHAYCDGGFQQYQFKVMPFGIAPGSSIFQAAFQRVVRNLPFCKVYIDDGVCSTDTESYDDHLQQLAHIFVRLEANNLTMKMTKSLWGTKTLPIVGHVIKAGQGCMADPSKIEAMLDLAPPSTIQLLKSLLGAAGYLSKYIESYAAIVLPLREMDDDRPGYTNIDEEWSPRRLRALDALKAALTTAPVLAAPDFSKPWIILTDCSDHTMGACLAQLDENGVERPVAYASANLTQAQKNYGITDKEGLAVVWAVRKYRHFLHGSSALVVTDHTCLRDLTTTKEFANKRLMRYAVTLSEHNLKVVYREGKVHHLPDLMSRMSRLTPGSLDSRKLCDEAMGVVAALLHGSNCSLGTRENGRLDSDMFSPGASQRRIRHVLSEVERDEGKTIAVILAELDSEKSEISNEWSGDEHDSRIMEFYDMVASAERVNMQEVTESQLADRFSQQMITHLTTEALPSDELEILKVVSLAPFYAVEQNVLIKLEKGKVLADKAKGTTTHGPPVKRIYVPEGLRSKLIQAVHEEVGHAKKHGTYEIVKSLFDWPTIHKDTVDLIKLCPKCQLHAKRAPEAPIMGHLRAEHPGQVVAMDILHLAKDTKCSGYMLIVIDVFSRYAMGTIIPDTKSETVAKALRDDILKHAWGRPDLWVCDGASYFNAEVKSSIAAWGSLMKVSAPHHSESHGIIERHNQTYTGMLACFGGVANWREYYSAAFESYNRSTCEALSSKDAKFSPMEIWRPGYTVTPYGLPTMKDIAPKHLQHFEDQKNLAQMINDTVKSNNEAYLKRMDERPSNVRKVKAIYAHSR